MRSPIRVKRKIDYGLIIGIALQVSAILLFGITYINTNKKDVIAVASKDINKYDVVEQGDYVMTLVEEDVARRIGSINPLGKVAMRDIKAGAFILPQDLGNDIEYLQKHLPYGTVGVSVPLKDENVVGGKVQPGDMLTLVGYYRTRSGEQEVHKVCTLLKSAPVIDIVGDRSNNVFKNPVLIFPAPIDTAKLISYVSGEGKLFAFLEKKQNASFDVNQQPQCSDVALPQESLKTIPQEGGQTQ